MLLFSRMLHFRNEVGPGTRFFAKNYNLNGFTILERTASISENVARTFHNLQLMTQHILYHFLVYFYVCAISTGHVPLYFPCEPVAQRFRNSCKNTVSEKFGAVAFFSSSLEN